jgi:carbon-monoxide dehydrogenase medium subunit/6-hydroxypseudooxynicotine dehydrogenase subunit alpha
VKPPAFGYARPETLPEALRLLQEGGEDAKVIAGGQSLMPLLAFRLARPTHLVDIGRLEGLGDVRAHDGGLAIGALTTHARVAAHPALRGPWRAIREAAGLIGHHPVRVRGTFGGSLAHADPAAELPVVAVLLDAEVVARSSTGERTITAGDLLLGPLWTSLEPDEVIVETRFPPPAAGVRSVFEEFHAHAGDFALASVAVAAALDEDGRVRHGRIALGSVAPVPARAHEAEALLEGRALTGDVIAEAASACATACDPPADRHASSDFRRDLVRALLSRALRRLKEES